MLLYLSSNENTGIFDFLQAEHGIMIKKLSGTFMLKQFVIYDMRSLDHYQYVAIDLQALKDTESEVIEAVIAFKKMFSSRIIFYMNDMINHESLIQLLIEVGIYNIVSAESVEKLNHNILNAISDLGMTKRDIQTKLRRLEIIDGIPAVELTFKRKNIRIAVTGADRKTGVTTTAMNLCSYLAALGASVCYVEANDHNHLMTLPKEYHQMVVKEDAIICNGVKYLQLRSTCEDDFDFIIYDMGVIEPKIISAIQNKCDAAILCATTKPYEMGSYNKAVQLLENVKIHRLFSFASGPEKARLIKLVDQAFFSEYSPDLFDGDKNKAIWERVIDPYVIKNSI